MLHRRYTLYALRILDWKKLDKDIKAFADKYSISTGESDFTFVEGQLTVYRFVENAKIYYELKHSKPIMERGSKLRIYSPATGELSIKVKDKIFGKLSVKSNLDLDKVLNDLLKKLGQKIGSFEWTTGPHHMGWPSELSNSNMLTFTCKRIDLAVDHLEPIRQIHLELLEKNSV